MTTMDKINHFAWRASFTLLVGTVFFMLMWVIENNWNMIVH